MMDRKVALSVAVGTALALSVSASQAESYGPYPITLQKYSGEKKNSVAYTGQVARHVLHNSLKKAISSGKSRDEMQKFWAGHKGELVALDPKTKDGFPVTETDINKISSGKNLNKKTLNRVVAGWPNEMTGPEMVELWLDKAAKSDKGFDAKSGMDYTQLVSKYLMGAVFYNQACDGYLDEKLNADNKPNNKPYKKGAYYTGKEHSWDEAFGYWGAPAHAMSLTPKSTYNIAKGKGLDVADANGNGSVDLKSEMTFAHAYYAADADKSGKTKYLHTITQAFIDGRKLITAADGKALTDSQRSELRNFAATICDNWERVIAEATFKYAGSVYKDIEKLKTIIEANGDATKMYRTYAKHYGELKGFALALQSGRNDLGKIGEQINSLTGYGPVTLDGRQISGFTYNEKYSYQLKEMDGFALHMLKLQKLLDDNFNLLAKKNNKLSEIAAVTKALGDSGYVEND